VLDSIHYNTERCVDYSSYWVVTHGGAEVEISSLLVTVEKVTVVMVRIACRRVGDGIGGRVYRVIIEGTQHVTPLSYLALRGRRI
jgi:hypothetical protein